MSIGTTEPYVFLKRSDILIVNEQQYVDWLISQICVGKHKHYKLLLKRLWDKEFYSLVPHDDNRAADGLNFRRKWYNEISGGDGEPNFGPCRVLECLLGLEERITEQLFGSLWADDMEPAEIFWELVNNMGLTQYSDDYFDDRIMSIDAILLLFLERKYSKNGSGGNIFVIEETDKDFRKLELWSQMMLYCRWRWPI